METGLGYSRNAAMKHKQVRQRCLETFHDYVLFNKAIFFILGLIFSYKLVEKTFFDILITHLADLWKKYDYRKATAVVNLREGTTAVLLPFFAYVADVRTGRFRMVIFSTTVCIVGLSLNILAARNDDNEQLELGLFYFALGLLTLAQAAHTVTLQAFLDDQLQQTSLTPVAAAAAADAAANATDLGTDIAASASAIESGRRRSKFWWNIMSILATVLAIFGHLREQFWILATVLTSVMAVCFLVFLLGTNYYYIVDTIENPFKDVEIVIQTAIANRRLEYAQTPEELSQNSSGDVRILPRVPWLRWLDRAAISRGNQPNTPPNVEQVSRVKRLLKMLPLWSCFLTLSLVVASGSTFFIDKATSLAEDDDLRPILFFTNLVKITESVVSGVSSYAIDKLQHRYKLRNKQKMELWRIGIGMSCCVPCCIAAWATTTAARMNVYLLTPQYLLLGIMGGLSEEGLQSFYESQVVESLHRFGPPFGEFTMGIGKFLSILCILVFCRKPFRWFRIDLDNSRLDKYYIFLALLSSVNVGIYCLVARWYVDDAFLVKDAAIDDDLEMGNTTAHRPGEGQRISHRSLSRRRTVSNPEGMISSSGDNIITESSASGSGSGSRQQVEEEAAEKPLLPSASTKNYLARLRVVALALRLFSRAAR